MSSNKHYSVMLAETIDSLNIKPDGIYVDLTLGMGGHSQEILKKLNKDGLLIGFDKDLFAISQTNKKLKEISMWNNFKLIHSDFYFIKNELKKLQITEVDGIIADLGVSSPQIDNPDRGFSYMNDGPLDMRMDQNQNFSAFNVVNEYDENKLKDILRNYADVKLAPQVAKAIVQNRPIKTTLELVNVIKKAYPAKLLRLKNPAKAVFQAIRIEVNHEFDSITKMLEDSITFLKTNANLSVITFHSLEDRIVKKFFGNLIKNKLPNKLPVNEIKNFTVKTVNPSQEEIEKNNRSRSAKLRILTKIS